MKKTLKTILSICFTFAILLTVTACFGAKIPQGDNEIYEFYKELCSKPHNAQAFKVYMTFDNEVVVYKTTRWGSDYYDCYLLTTTDEGKQEYWIVDNKSYRCNNGETPQKDASFEPMLAFIYYEALMPIDPLAKEDLNNLSSRFDYFANAIIVTFEAQTTYGTKLCYTITSLRPKSEVQSNLRFSFISSLNLLKSRVFAIIIMGLFFPSFGVEQDHFSPLTTCLTSCGDF